MKINNYLFRALLYLEKPIAVQFYAQYFVVVIPYGVAVTCKVKLLFEMHTRYYYYYTR